MINGAVCSPWAGFTPTVYRMMGREYVDRFFKTGELLISSFDKFSKHSDEQRLDNEGRNILVAKGSNSTVISVTAHGQDSYILCGTARKDIELFKKFGCDAAIRIYDTTGFGQTILRHLPGVQRGIEGFCVYHDEWIESNPRDLNTDQIVNQLKEKKVMDSKVLYDIVNAAGPGVYFQKQSRFFHQTEYRWVWITDHEVRDSSMIHVPDARNFCAAVYLDELV